MRCRGQVTPAADALVYEVFVDEVRAGPMPDGLRRPALHRRRPQGVPRAPRRPAARARLAARALAQLGPPRRNRPARRAAAPLGGLVGHVEPKPVASVDGFSLRLRVAARLRVGPALDGLRPDVRALRRHAPRRAPARAAVPLHVARHADRRARWAACKPGSGVEVEYDVPDRRLVLRRERRRHDAVLRAAWRPRCSPAAGSRATSAARSRRDDGPAVPQPRRHRARCIERDRPRQRHAAHARSTLSVDLAVGGR